MDYPKTVPNVNLLAGKFTDGDPANGVPASLDPAEWANAVTQEILAVLANAGIAPIENTNNQLLAAILAIIGTQIEDMNPVPNVIATAIATAKTQVQNAVPGIAAAQFVGSLAQSGYLTLPGGLMIQWADVTIQTAYPVAEQIAFPVAFPHNRFGVVGSVHDQETASWATVMYGGQSVPNVLTSFMLYATGSGTAPHFQAFYIALGN